MCTFRNYNKGEQILSKSYRNLLITNHVNLTSRLYLHLPSTDFFINNSFIAEKNCIINTIYLYINMSNLVLKVTRKISGRTCLLF